ncbi:MAG: hypothetical protein ACRCW2_12580 [Cellulosilyticaceae bacterium]
MQKKTNREKFKEMNGKQKIEYIWTYYRWHIVGVLAAIFIVGEIYRIATTPRPEYKIHTVISGKLANDPAKQEADIDMFYEKFGSDLYFMQTDWSAPGQATMSSEQLLNLKMQVREIDVLAISDVRHQIFMQIDRFDPFVKLDTIPELAPILEKYKDQLVTGKSRVDGKEYVYGIKVNTLNGLPSIALGEAMVVSLIDPPKDMEACIEVLEYLLK